MRKALMAVTVAAAVGIGSLSGGLAVKTEAQSISSLKSQKSKIDSQRSNLNSDIKEADQKITEIKGQQADVQSELKRLELAIGSTNNSISEKTAKYEETKAQIAKMVEDIGVIRDRIQKRNVLLKDRARNYQENGSVNYVNVLMGAQSFSDFIDIANAVATIVEADQAILEQAEADKQELEHKQTQVQTESDNLKKTVADLQNLNIQLNTQQKQQTDLMGTLQQQEKEASEDKMDMQEQAQILAAQSSAIQKAIQNEQAAAKAPSSSGSSGTTAAAPPVSSGNFTRPASGVVSSTYGARWGTFHYGVDIANSGSNVPILAAASGVVVTAHYSSSYGNVVYIAHSINGHVYTTVYAHMSRFIVSTGQSVSKGQQIGIMGSTGDSTGQHLHFELYNGPWAYHSAINPMGIVPF